MSPEHRAGRLGAVAGALGVVVGTAEVVLGTSRWLGDKDDPTTLGVVTVALAILITGVGVVADRAPAPATRLWAAATLGIAGVIGSTTAGPAGLPTAVLAVAAGWSAVRTVPAATARRLVRTNVRGVLVIGLAVILLVFGLVAGGTVGWLGVTGAAAAAAALGLRCRSPHPAAGLLVAGTLPFAVASWWTVVVPTTSALLLVIGLPYVLARPSAPGPGAGRRSTELG